MLVLCLINLAQLAVCSLLFSPSLDEASERYSFNYLLFFFLFSIIGLSVNLLCRRVMMDIVEIR